MSFESQLWVIGFLLQVQSFLKKNRRKRMSISTYTFCFWLMSPSEVLWFLDINFFNFSMCSRENDFRLEKFSMGSSFLDSQKRNASHWRIVALGLQFSPPKAFLATWHDLSVCKKCSGQLRQSYFCNLVPKRLPIGTKSCQQHSFLLFTFLK